MKLKIVFYLLLSFSIRVHPAGYADGRESAPGATKLNLNPGERPRDASSQKYGAGLETRYLTVDVVVAGGGSAGSAAGLASARSGAKTVVVQSRKVLGGNASSESRLHMVGAGKQGNRGTKLETEPREGGIVEEYTLKNAVTNPQRCAENFDLDLYDLYRQEPNAILLLNTELVSAVKDGSKTITTIIAENQSSQIRYIIKAKVFIDATGDGRLGAEAYVPYIIGREGKEVFNESLAEPHTDNETEGSSFAFTSRDNGRPMPFTPPTWARKFTESDFKYRHISSNALDYGYWWVEISYPYNTIRDNEIIRDKLMENILGIWDYIKNSGNYPNAVNRSLDWFQWWPCKREGRRFRGLYIQSQNDILPDPKSKTFPPKLYWDRVAYSGWNFDLHNPKGIYDTAHPPYTSYALPFVFSTPLRSLIASNVTNMMLAGRLSSFSHVVFGSQRVMKTGATMGQAAGTAAAYCAVHDIKPIDLATNKDAVWSIQQQLIRDDAYVIGLYNEDPRDYALKATNISASSEWVDTSLDGYARHIISGQTRAMFGPGGVPSSQTKPGVNRWVSRGLPSWIQLKWNQPIPSIAQIEIIFDTGMHRALTLSQKEADQSKMQWGRPQEETVADYSIEVTSDETNWKTILQIKGNYQRRRVHRVSAQNVRALKMMVTKTNGLANAHVFEIRVYDQEGMKPFPVKPSLFNVM